MTMSAALVHNQNRLDNFIGYSAGEMPLALQLGGSSPEEVGNVTNMCENFGYCEEINLNCGCPSNRAKKCGFGAELMLEPDLVRRISYEMMRKATTTKISVKCRIGVTGRESWEELIEFVEAVRASGVRKVIVHARICVLRGLSPAENRTIPPLFPETVHKLAARFPEMEFVMNGGIEDFHMANAHLGIADGDADDRYAKRLEGLPPVHGVMIGRAAYRNPWMFASADRQYFKRSFVPACRRAVVEEYLDYAEKAQQDTIYGSNTCNIVKPMHNAFTDCEGNHAYKQKLDQLLKKCSRKVDEGCMRLSELVHDAMQDTIPDAYLDEPFAAVD